ncbi:hypothetical protein V8D89_002323 [Ganoderma adspersum]
MATPPGSQPSAHWLQQSAWIDGARNPPRFYATLDKINADRIAAGYAPLPPQQAPLAPEAPPAPIPPPAPVAPPALAPARSVAGGLLDAIVAEGNTDGMNAVVMAGHRTSVFVTHTKVVEVVVAAGHTSHSSTKKMKEKTVQSVKSDHIILEGCSRINFINTALAVHNLATQYQAGQLSGPAVKVWWTGAGGGKNAVSTIENDHDFEVAKAAILKKKKDKCTVFIEFDLDTMEGFRIKKWIRRPFMPIAAVLGPSDSDDELYVGTKVPRTDAFDDATQLHGHIILQLKAQWPCDKHRSEHGEQGFCYIDPNGNHLGLNMRKLKVWAVAIAAYEATKYVPPNTVDFDSARDGRVVSVHPRGHPTQGSNVLATSSDITTLLMAAVVPLITNHLLAIILDCDRAASSHQYSNNSVTSMSDP